jgi:hypothetical protein
MKKGLIILTVVWVSACSSPETTKTGDAGTSTSIGQASALVDQRMPTAYHEFEMFGKDRIYLSHYPMFHAIHAYQVIVRARVEKDGRSVLDMDFYKARSPRYNYRVSPSVPGSPHERRRDDWILPEYMKTGVSFNADIHWGPKDQFHLEDVTVTIEDVIFIRRFEDEDEHNAKLTYILFGTPGDYYLAHRIANVPDFDQILSVELLAGAVDQQVSHVWVVDKPDSVKDRLRANSSTDGILSRIRPPRDDRSDVDPNPTPLGLKIESEVHLEEELIEQG